MTASWTPSALKARLRAQEALAALPRRAWGIYAEAGASLAEIVGQVDQHRLAPSAATEQLQQLTGRLLLHHQAESAYRTRNPSPLSHRGQYISN